jgi:hypothetical protein
MHGLDDPGQDMAHELLAHSEHGFLHILTDGEKRPVSAKGVILEKERIVEEQLKHLMQELGNAINESLSESDRIAAAIGEIKNAGYEVFLVLEATIGFNKRGDAAEETEAADKDAPKAAQPEFKTAGRIKWTSQDQKFLRALKISVDERTGA